MGAEWGSRSRLGDKSAWKSGGGAERRRARRASDDDDAHFPDLLTATWVLIALIWLAIIVMLGAWWLGRGDAEKEVPPWCADRVTVAQVAEECNG